jgi:hypothetical protein
MKTSQVNIVFTMKIIVTGLKKKGNWKDDKNRQIDFDQTLWLHMAFAWVPNNKFRH